MSWPRAVAVLAHNMCVTPPASPEQCLGERGLAKTQSSDAGQDHGAAGGGFSHSAFVTPLASVPSKSSELPGQPAWGCRCPPLLLGKRAAPAANAPRLILRVGVASAFELCWAARSSRRRRALVLPPPLQHRRDPLTSALLSDLRWALLRFLPQSPDPCHDPLEKICFPGSLASFRAWPSASPRGLWEPGFAGSRGCRAALDGRSQSRKRMRAVCL